MIGYVQKDSGKSSYVSTAHNVTEEELKNGRADYGVSLAT